MWAGVKAAATLLFVERDGERRVGTHGVTSPPPPPAPARPFPPQGTRYAGIARRTAETNELRSDDEAF